MMAYTRGMKVVATLIVAWAALAVGASAQASVIRLTLTSTSKVSATQIARAEKAVTYQVNHQLRRYWVVPEIRFVPSGGDPVFLIPGGGIMGAGGAHEQPGPTVFGNFRTPSAFAATGDAQDRFTVTGRGHSRVSWTVALSHEVMEMLVNPNVTRKAPHRFHHRRVWVEVADAVEADVYRVDGVQVSDFVTPRWFEFSNVNFMRYDFMGKLSAPYTLAPGGYMPGSAADTAHNNL